MSKSRIKVDNGYFFVVSLILFSLNSTLIMVFLSKSFKNTSDLYSLYFAVAGALLVFKTFVASYANYTSAIRSTRYYALVANFLLMIFQFVCFYLALFNQTENTYPRITVGLYSLATLGLLAQLAIGKLSNSIKLQVFGLLYYVGVYAMLQIGLFLADVRFLQIISVTNIIVELILVLNLYRQFQLQSIVAIKPVE
jgi:hypothetical protein